MSKYEGAQPAERDATPESLVPDVRGGIVEILKLDELWSWRVLDIDKAADQIFAYLHSQGWRKVDPKKLPLIVWADLASVKDWYGHNPIPIHRKAAIAQRSSDLRSLGIKEK